MIAVTVENVGCSWCRLSSAGRPLTSLVLFINIRVSEAYVILDVKLVDAV